MSKGPTIANKSEDASSSSSWIQSAIVEILTKKEHGAGVADGFPKEQLLNQLLLMNQQDSTSATETKRRRKIEKVLEKLLSKGIIDQKESVGKCLILLKDYKGSTDKKRKITLVAKENNQNESEEFDERKTKKKKKKKTRAKVLNDSSPNGYSTSNTESDAVDDIQQPTQLPLPYPVDYRYILAPMVGASELPFRLLCRKYGATLAYTPMMCSKQFARDEAYRKKEFQTIPEDRPLVVHFSANDPNDFAASAKIVQHLCDAIDLNLGCPQRTAYLGHFGSYLLDPKDRKLIVSIVRRAREEVSIPIFCKIRLLDTIDDTIQLCRDLRDAGASLIAIHARYRATWDRKGPGARDGPALLDQVKLVKQALSDIPIISNGNIITFDDCERNLKFTMADGVMSAEGILDNPALFLPRYQKEVSIQMNGEEKHSLTEDKAPVISVKWPADLPPSLPSSKQSTSNTKQYRKLLKKIREIERLEEKINIDRLNEEEKAKLSRKSSILKEIGDLKGSVEKQESSILPTSKNVRRSEKASTSLFCLDELYESSQNKLDLAKEYLTLVRKFPASVRTIIFHIRRMCRDVLNKYQLMEECINCESIEGVESIISKCVKYDTDPSTFHFDLEKQKREKEALEKKKREEGKRKAFEGRMIRKAKREGLDDVEFYLRQGSKIPSMETIALLKHLPREKQLDLWKRDHSQHCLSYHLSPEGCSRSRACAFLHMDPVSANEFNEMDEVAG